MPISFRVDHEQRRLYTDAEGVITLADLQKHIDEEIRVRGPGYTELFDATRATTTLTADEVRQLVDRIRVRFRDKAFGACAFVTRSEVFYGMLRMFQILREPDDAVVGVFRDRDEALRWLDEVSAPDAGH
jgi:hypothetical protein